MADAAQHLDKNPKAIQDMFSAVAPRYDMLNRVLSARRDVAWRRAAAAALRLPAGSRVLDLCCGTGDQALAVRDSQSSVVAADFSLSMLGLAARKIAPLSRLRPQLLAADSLRMPFESAVFDGVTVSFGLRNVESLQLALNEIARLLVPGGKVAILEFAVPERALLRKLYLTYCQNLLPRIGAWMSPRGSAYQYLPDSVMTFPQRREFTQQLTEVGIIDTAWSDLSGGIVCLYTGTKSL